MYDQIRSYGLGMEGQPTMRVKKFRLLGRVYSVLATVSPYASLRRKRIRSGHMPVGVSVSFHHHSKEGASPTLMSS